jgi:cell division protein FtsB
MIVEKDTSSQEKKEMDEGNEGSRDKRKLTNWLTVAGHVFALLLIITPAIAFVIRKATDDSHSESRCMVLVSGLVSCLALIQ